MGLDEIFLDCPGRFSMWSSMFLEEEGKGEI
jgi:hypothetical protein